MRIATALLAPLALLGAGVLYATNANAIANGEVVPEGKYRFSVKLTMTGIPTADGGRRNSGCSGALVAQQWVITAGHCNRDFNNVRVDGAVVADLVTATIGRADLTGTNGVERRVVNVRQSQTNDLALFQLDQPVPRSIRPIELASSPPEVGEVLRLTGYGSVTSVNPTPSLQLRTGQLSVTAVTDTTIQVTGHAPQPDTTPCPFDSGGPYFVEKRFRAPKLVSVVSFGPSCPHTAEETTSRVDNIRGWIRSIING